MEVCRLIEHQTVTIAQDIGREPSIQSEASGTDNRSKTTLYKSLSRLEVLAGNRHLGLLCEFPHSRNIYSSIRSTHNKRSTLGQCSISVAHRRSDVLTVVCLHCSLKSSQRAMDFHIYRHINLSRSSPDNNDTCTSVLFLEVTNILTQSLYHFPTGLAVLHIVTIKALCIILIESRLHRNHLFQFLTNRIYILLLQHFCIHSSLICILRINIPGSKHDIIKTCQRNNILIMQILLVSTTAHTNLIILGH